MEGYFLEDDGRVSIEYGPISAVITALVNGEPQLQAIAEVLEDNHYGLTALLHSLHLDLALLAKAWPKLSTAETARLQPLGQDLWQNTRITTNLELTPLSGVAGLIADYLVQGLKNIILDNPDYKDCTEQNIKIIVNNGGDISFYLQGNEQLKLGLPIQTDIPNLNQIVKLTPASTVQGIATSGLGGRGLTQGVATAVTTFAKTGVLADALATSLANASYIASPKVTRVLARTLRPSSDIADLLVTTQVLPLDEQEIFTAWSNIQQAALPLVNSGVLLTLRANIGDQEFWLNNKDNYLTLN